MVELSKGVAEYSDAELRGILLEAREAHSGENDAFLKAQDAYYANESDNEKLVERNQRKAEVLRLFNLIQGVEMEMVRRFTA